LNLPQKAVLTVAAGSLAELAEKEDAWIGSSTFYRRAACTKSFGRAWSSPRPEVPALVASSPPVGEASLPCPGPSCARSSTHFSGEIPSNQQRKYLTPDKHSPYIHLTAAEAQIASSFKKAGKGKLAERIEFKHNQGVLRRKDEH